MKTTIYSKTASNIILGLLLSSILTLPTFAGGKKPSSTPVSPAPSCPAAPAISKPPRAVLLQMSQIKPFELPGRRMIDVKDDLAHMSSTEAGRTQAFSPAEFVSTPCDSHLELIVSVSALELNLTTIGLTIGYSPTGIHTGLTEVQGDVDVSIGQLAMEFAIRECNANGCFQKIATSVTQNMVDSVSKFTMNFDTINGSLDLVTHPAFNNFLRKMLSKGMAALAADPGFNLLPWHATIREVNAAAGTLIFDAGANNNLFPNQNFSVYAVSPTTGECHVYKVLAYAHTIRVDTVSSLAAIDAVLDSKNIQEGDIVMVKPQ